MVIREAVLESPFMYLHAIQNTLLQTTGTNVSTATICKFLHSQGFSHKKLAFRAQQRRDELRAQFASDISLFEPHMFVYVNETGSDKRSLLQKYGYAFKGARAITEKPLVRGKRYSAIAAMCMDGVIDIQITTESVNGGKFCDFLECCLLHQLLPYNGVNARSVVILDNASIHHMESATHLIEETGALAIFLPPYSPDYTCQLNNVFKKIKSYLRVHDPLIPVLAELEIEELILSACTSVTADDSGGWMEDCGYII